MTPTHSSQLCSALSWIWNSIFNTPFGYHVYYSKLTIWKAGFVIQYLTLYPLLMLLFLLVVLTFFQLTSETSVLSLIPLISSLSQSDDSFQSCFFYHISSLYRTTHSSKLSHYSLISGLCILRLIWYTDFIYFWNNLFPLHALCC